MLFSCSKLGFYLQFTEEIFFFSRFYKLNNEKLYVYGGTVQYQSPIYQAVSA